MGNIDIKMLHSYLHGIAHVANMLGSEIAELSKTQDELEYMLRTIKNRKESCRTIRDGIFTKINEMHTYLNKED